MGKTLEQFAKDGGDVTSCIREETLLLHGSFLTNKNTLEARIVSTIVLPDGSKFHADKVIKVKFRREKQ